jgi:hypothetical protein
METCRLLTIAGAKALYGIHQLHRPDLTADSKFIHGCIETRICKNPFSMKGAFDGDKAFDDIWVQEKPI